MLGCRRSDIFLGYTAGRQDGKFLRLDDEQRFLACMQNSETRITFLRQWASRWMDNIPAVIQYTPEFQMHPGNTDAGFINYEEILDVAPFHDHELGQFHNFDTETSSTPLKNMEYATAVKIDIPYSKHDLDGKTLTQKGYMRWLSIIS
jgi:hypothetical protein